VTKMASSFVERLAAAEKTQVPDERLTTVSSKEWDALRRETAGGAVGDGGQRSEAHGPSPPAHSYARRGREG
jgi:hypothetical protein